MSNPNRPTECPTCLRAFKDDYAIDLNELVCRSREQNRLLQVEIAKLRHQADLTRLESQARRSSSSQKVIRQAKEIRRLQERLAKLATSLRPEVGDG